MLKQHLTPSSLLEALNARFATKVFDPARKLSQQQWSALQETLRLSPSSFGLQPWKFVNIESTDLRAKLRESSWGQAQVTDASHLVVLMARTDFTADDIATYLADIAKTRGVALETLESYKGMMEGSLLGLTAEQKQVWARSQAYIALGNLLTAAAVLGIDACPMEGFDKEAYDAALNIEGYTTCVICPLGFASEDDKYASLPKVRYDLEKVFEAR